MSAQQPVVQVPLHSASEASPLTALSLAEPFRQKLRKFVLGTGTSGAGDVG